MAGTLSAERPPEPLRWDVAYTMAVYRFPRWLIYRLLDGTSLLRHGPRFAWFMRQLRSVAKVKARLAYRILKRTPVLSAS